MTDGEQSDLRVLLGGAGKRLLDGTWQHGYVLAPAMVVAGRRAEDSDVSQALDVLVDEGLLARLTNPRLDLAKQRLQVLAPRKVRAGRYGQLTDEAAKILRYWLRIGLIPRDDRIGRVVVPRLLAVSPAVAEQTLAMLAGAGDLRDAGWGYMHPEGRGRLDKAIQAVTKELRGRGAQRPLNVKELADQLPRISLEMVWAALAYAWAKQLVYPVDEGDGSKTYMTGPIPEGAQARVEAMSAGDVRMVATWLDRARLLPAESVPALRMRSALGLSTRACFEALAFHHGEGRLSHTGVTYVMRGEGMDERAEAVPRVLRDVAGYVSDLPLNSTMSVDGLKQALRLTEQNARRWVAWLIGARVLEYAGRASYLVRARPPDRVMPVAS